MRAIRSLTAGALVVLTVVLGGCGKNEYALSAQDRAAFKDATPEIRQTWEQGLQADRANDYLNASTNFRALLTRQLSPDQLVAVQTALGGLNYRINEAAARGEASARKALEGSQADAVRR